MIQMIVIIIVLKKTTFYICTVCLSDFWKIPGCHGEILVLSYRSNDFICLSEVVFSSWHSLLNQTTTFCIFFEEVKQKEVYQDVLVLWLPEL